MRWIVGVAIASLLLLPAAAGGQAHGQFALRAISLADFVDLDAAAHAAYAADTTHVTAFELRASRVTVDVWTMTYAEVRLVQGIDPSTNKTHASYALTNVHARLVPSQDEGWLGLRTTAPLHASLDPGATVAHASTSRIGTGDPRSDADHPDEPYFSQSDNAPHLLANGLRSIELRGPASVRFAGLHVELAAAENDTVLETGWTRDSGPVGQARAAWATLQFDDGTLLVDGLASASLQSGPATATWTGAALLAGATGSFSTADATWTASGEDAIVRGALTAILAPGPDGIDAQVGGELDASTMPQTTHAVRAAAPAPLLPWLLGALALGAVAGGGAAYGLIRWRRAAREPTTEDLVELAFHAAESEDYPRALRWIRQARDRAPTSQRIAFEEAGLLELSGDVDASLRTYQDLGRRLGDGEASFAAARLLARSGAHEDDVAPWLVRALQSEPLCALELRSEEALSPLATRADVRAALRDAEARLG